MVDYSPKILASEEKPPPQTCSRIHCKRHLGSASLLSYQRGTLFRLLTGQTSSLTHESLLTYIQMQLNAHRALTQQHCVRPGSVGTCHGNDLTCNSSRNARPQWSQFAEPLWTYPGLKSEIGACELIST